MNNKSEYFCVHDRVKKFLIEKDIGKYYKYWYEANETINHWNNFLKSTFVHISCYVYVLLRYVLRCKFNKIKFKINNRLKKLTYNTVLKNLCIYNSILSLFIIYRYNI